MAEMEGKKLKIRCIREVLSIYAKYRPQVGKVYEAEYGKSKKNIKEYCIVDILDKRIVLRKGEFEIIGG